MYCSAPRSRSVSYFVLMTARICCNLLVPSGVSTQSPQREAFMSRVVAALLLVLFSTNCPAEPRKPPGPLAITHVTDLPMTPDAAPLRDMTVIIRDGRIASIAPASKAGAAAGARKIDGRGKWLMPGFSDMHMHLENDRMGRLHVGDPTLPDGTFDLAEALTLYLANGVLQVFNLSSMSETIGQQVEVESGRVL